MRGKFIALFLYGVAMAFLESAVVVYLRALYYPENFSATAGVNFSPLIYTVDLVREAATIIMLATVAYLAFSKVKDRLITFLWLFAIWDLFYYLFLKIILDWPKSLTELDVLFLIPVPWIAPVWFPVLISLSTFTVTSYLLFKKIKHN